MRDKIWLSGISVNQLFILCGCRSGGTERLYWGMFLRSTQHPGEWSPNREYNINHPRHGRDIARAEDPPRVSDFLQDWDRPHSRQASSVYAFVPVFLFPVVVNENALLPLLLEELPHLDISSHTQGRMRQQQKQQVDRLRSVASPSSRHHSKLSSQVGPWLEDSAGPARFVCFTLMSSPLWQLEEAQRKHDLLVEILHRDQEHKRRLVSPSSLPPSSASWVHRHMRPLLWFY